MKTLAIKNGDLAIGANGYATIEGAAKVQQDLGLAVREPLGTDRFHPQWGSLLPRYIGEPINDEMTSLVQAEVTRIVQNYIIQQGQVLRGVVAGRRKPKFEANEVVTDIGEVHIRQTLDRLHTKVVLVTLGSRRITIIAPVEG